jgi:pimeloyl-ACP methyl ester carboxylesterase
MTSNRTNEIIEEHISSGKFFNVEGIKTFALDYGEGEAVVCLHGVPTSSFLYRKVLKELQMKGYRGISIDLPGFGFSDRPEYFEYSFLNFANFLTFALHELGVDKFHLVVHDIGGPIGFAMAAANKEKISSLTILNTWIDVVNFKKPLPMRPFEIPLLGESELALLNHTTWHLMFKTLGVQSEERISREEIDSYVDILKHGDGGKAFLKIMRNFDTSDEFREICFKAVQDVPYPVQAIWGVKDPALNYERFGEEIKEVAGLDDVYQVEARHFLQEEQWEIIADKIEQVIEMAHDMKEK